VSTTRSPSGSPTPRRPPEATGSDASVALDASIPIVASPVAHDSMAGGGRDPAMVSRIRVAGPLPVGPEVGETVRLPDVVLADRPEEAEGDDLSATLTYHGVRRRPGRRAAHLGGAFGEAPERKTEPRADLEGAKGLDVRPVADAPSVVAT
jgi:hypothetical protein